MISDVLSAAVLDIDRWRESGITCDPDDPEVEFVKAVMVNLQLRRGMASHGIEAGTVRLTLESVDPSIAASLRKLLEQREASGKS